MATRIMPAVLVLLLASTSAVARTYVVRPDDTGDFATGDIKATLARTWGVQ